MPHAVSQVPFHGHFGLRRPQREAEPQPATPASAGAGADQFQSDEVVPLVVPTVIQEEARCGLRCKPKVITNNLFLFESHNTVKKSVLKILRHDVC